MAEAAAFETACAELEAHTSLSRLEARGTVRLALKRSGLDSRSVTPEQMAVVVERVLGAELASRGIEDPDGVCAALLGSVRAAAIGAASAAETPEDVFRRLGGT